jgi:hypothetical protein
MVGCLIIRNGQKMMGLVELIYTWVEESFPLDTFYGCNGKLNKFEV